MLLQKLLGKVCMLRQKLLWKVCMLLQKLLATLCSLLEKARGSAHGVRGGVPPPQVHAA